MTVWTLGISAFFHDSAAALIRDGEIVAAAQEERFSRVKNDARFPISAITYCLEQGGIDSRELASIAFYEKPLLVMERMVESFQSGAKDARKSWLKSAPHWVGEKLHIDRIIYESLEFPNGDNIFYLPHHLSHAATAFYPSPFERAAILTVDGVGEWATASIGIGEGRHVSLIKEMRFPDSLGLLYSAFTHFCGFKVNSGEYKLMGLAPYGEPKYLDMIMDHIATVHDDGYIEIDHSYFDYVGGARMTSPRFASLFDGEARRPESPITRREMDLAASIQAFTNLVMEKMAAHAKRVTGLNDLCLAGGVALNCVANGKLLSSGMFHDLWIQPAAGDAGSALGAALAVQHGLHEIKRAVVKGDAMKGAYLGPSFSQAEVGAYLSSYQIPHTKLEPRDYADTVAAALADGKIVGFFNGRMEFGPRALGARSILGNPMLAETQKQMNLQIKYRESFRPFAPSVLAEDVASYFDLDCVSPYMLLVAPVLESRRIKRERETPLDDLLVSVSQVRSDIPAVTHWDYSARVQTVHKETNPLYHEVIQAFKKRTGIGVIVNTSFNVRGEPIVCTPEDAYRCLLNTDIDHLFIEGYWISKADLATLSDRDRERWRSRFALD
jgi:carbamoyltransferase